MMQNELPDQIEIEPAPLSELNAALSSGDPVKIAVAIYALDRSLDASSILSRHGTNPGLWEVMAMLRRAGVRLSAE